MESSSPEARQEVAVVTVTEGPEFWMDAAFLAGGVRAAGFRARRVATDFCTEEEAFQAELRALDPAAVVFPYAAEFREILLHLSHLARHALEVPVIVAGEALGREAEAPQFEDGVLSCPHDPGAGIGGLIREASVPAADPAGLAGVAFDPDLFGDRKTLAAFTMKASLFRDTGSLALLATRGDPQALSPTSLLARCEAACAGGPVALESAAALRPLEEVAEVTAIEWWDGDVSPALLDRVAEASQRIEKQAVRVRPEGRSPELLDDLRERGASRVIFEVDRLEGVTPLEGSSAAVEDLATWFQAARESGLETGVLLVIGLPGETRARGTARLEALRHLAPDRLRCVPFEPTGGHPAYARLKREGVLPPEGKRWNRELHRPLIQDCLDREAFLANWSDAHLLLAEVEAAR